VRRRRSFRRSLCLAAAAMFAFGAVASADYRASFERGIKAIDNKDWSGAIEALRGAVAEKSAEGERVLIYGMRYKAYLPHYYLGLAYFNTGNCEAAMKAWAESERQGPVREAAEYRTLQRLREQCRGQGIREGEPASLPSPARGPDVRQAIAEAEAEIKKGESAATAVARMRGEPENTRLWQSDPSLRQSENKANLDLSSARSVLAEARAGNDAARVAVARDTALRARRELEALQRLVVDRRDRLASEALEKQAKERDAAEKRAALERQALEKQSKESQAKESLAKERTSAESARTILREVGQSVQEARAVLADASRRRPLPVEARNSRAELRKELKEARRAGPNTSVSDLTKLRDRVVKSAANLRMALNRPSEGTTPPPDRTIPPSLLAAADAYFQGDYNRAARTLEGANFQQPRAAAQARLLRGAARYGIFVTGGERDDRLRQKAIEDIRECLRLDPNIAVSSLAFSPRFVEFFKRSRSQTGG
jgi:hypothetical protein